MPKKQNKKYSLYTHQNRAYWADDDGDTDYSDEVFHTLIVADDAYKQFKTAAGLN